MQKKHVVVVGDSNIVGTPLSVLLRDAGAGTVTVCHRIAYNNLFGDRAAARMSPQLQVDACLPRLPGPYSLEKDTQQGASPWFSTRLPSMHDTSQASSCGTLSSEEWGSGCAHGLGRDSERTASHEVSGYMPKRLIVVVLVSCSV